MTSRPLGERRTMVHSPRRFNERLSRANCKSRTFFGNSHARDFMPQSGGLRRSRTWCRSLVDSTECHCLVDSAERLWLAVSDSNCEAPKAAPGLTWYSGAEAAVEARVESSKMTENSAEQNASSGTATGAAASSEEGPGWMRSTKVANLTVESNKKTEKGAEQNASSCAATREAACNGRGAGWMGSTKTGSLRVELGKVQRKGGSGDAISADATGACSMEGAGCMGLTKDVVLTNWALVEGDVSSKIEELSRNDGAETCQVGCEVPTTLLTNVWNKGDAGASEESMKL